MNERKTVFLIADQDFTIRYFVYTDFYKRFRENKSFRLVFFVYKKSICDYLRQHFGAENILFETFDREKVKLHSEHVWHKWTSRIAFFVLNAKYDINTAILNRKEAQYVHRLKNSSTINLFHRFFVYEMPIFFLRRSKLLRHMFRMLVNLFANPDIHKEFYDKYKPTSIIVASLGQREHFLMLKEANRHQVQKLSVILNWDNTTTKGMRTSNFDHIIVWNQDMKDDVIAHHDVPEDKVSVGGVAHYDMYYHKEEFLPHMDVCEKWGLDPARKVLVYGAMSPTRFVHNPDIIELLAKSCADNLFTYPCQLFVRLHPIYFMKLHSKNNKKFKQEYDRMISIQKKYGNVVYNFPDFVRLNPEGDILLSQKDMNDLVNIINVSSVLLCYFSTLMLEGSILDKPTISLCLDGLKFHYGQKKESVLQMTHLQSVLKSNGVKVVFSQQELIEAINQYLTDKDQDADGRERIRMQKCGDFAGQAGMTIAKKIEELVLQA